MNATALKNLDQFTGTENYYNFLPSFVITDGAKALADNADCYWLFDLIASYQSLINRSDEQMLKDVQFWTLRPCDGRPVVKTVGGVLSHTTVANPVAYVVGERDTDDAAIIQEIAMTDFPFDVLPEVRIYVCSDYSLPVKQFIAMLPNEY